MTELCLRTLFGQQHETVLERWRAQQWTAEHGSPDRLAPLLAIPQLQDLLAALSVGPDLIVANHFSRDGKNLANVHDLSGSQAISLYDMGATILCGDMIEHVPALRALTTALGTELGLPRIRPRGILIGYTGGNEPLEAISIFSPPGAKQGLGYHFDPFDGLAIQLAGSKVWKLGLPDVAYPMHPSYRLDAGGVLPADTVGYFPSKGWRAEDLPPMTEVEMVPGSVLLNPRGSWHCTESIGDAGSVSLVIRVLPPSGIEVLLNALYAKLSLDPAWRAPVIGLFGGPAARAAQTRRLAEMIAALDHSDPQGLVDSGFALPHAQPHMLKAEPAADASLIVSEAPNRQTPSAVVLVMRPGAAPARIDAAGWQVQACHWIAGRKEAFAIDDVPGDAPNTTLELLQALQAVGYLRLELEDARR